MGRTRNTVAEKLDRLVPFGLAALGVLHSEPAVYYSSLALCFVALEALVVGGGGLVTLLSERAHQRIQGPRRGSALIGRSIKDTSIAMWVAACLAAWPTAQYRLGQANGLYMSLEDAGVTLPQVVMQTVLGVFAIDAWLYWKHRVLHTRPLFVFHRGHHGYRDPTPLGGFAVGPVEAVITFWPILFLCFPEAVHWAPLYFGLVGGFIVLNFYLHCGVEIRVVEAVLPRLLLNTSAFHNKHHAHVGVNYGEALILWDRICKTRKEDYEARGSRFDQPTPA